MKKRLTILISVLTILSLFLSGCALKGAERNEEYLDQSTRIVTLGTGDAMTVKLEYVKGDNMYSLPFGTAYRPALDWLKTNSYYEEKVMTWWENGHMIQGYARRQPVAFTPCSEITDLLSSAWNEDQLGELSDCTILTNIAYAFLADTPTVTTGIMKRLGAKWVFVTKNGMIKLLGDNRGDYIDDAGDIKGNVLHKTLFQMTSGTEVKGFRLAYADEFAAVYELLPETAQ
jgi:asparagine N-glycosylation enzyme membrane subunit Stt3